MMTPGLGAHLSDPLVGHVMTGEEARDPDACGGGYYAGTAGYQFTHIPMKVGGTEDDWTCREMVRCEPGEIDDDDPELGLWTTTDTQLIRRCKPKPAFYLTPNQMQFVPYVAAGFFALWLLGGIAK